MSDKENKEVETFETTSDNREEELDEIQSILSKVSESRSELPDNEIEDRWSAAQELVFVVAEALTSEEEDVRGAAFQSLMAMGDVALSILPNLRDIMQSPNFGDLTKKNRIQLLALAGHLIRLQKRAMEQFGGFNASKGSPRTYVGVSS